jgi:hypothetical protein
LALIQPKHGVPARGILAGLALSGLIWVAIAALAARVLWN